jgi:hypothetical protein
LLQAEAALLLGQSAEPLDWEGDQDEALDQSASFATSTHTTTAYAAPTISTAPTSTTSSPTIIVTTAYSSITVTIVSCNYAPSE